MLEKIKPYQGSSSLIISMTTPTAVVLIGEWCGW